MPVTDTTLLRARKTAIRDQRHAARRDRRAQRRLHRKCFWTRPFGHVYEAVQRSDDRPIADSVCIACGKTK